MPKFTRKNIHLVLSVILCLFTIAEVNNFQLSPLSQSLSQLAIFAMLGIVLCFLNKPFHPPWKDNRWLRMSDIVLAVLTALCCLYVVIQTEPIFKPLWANGQSLGDRVGEPAPFDWVAGVFGVVLFLEATRRSIGYALPILAILFLLYAVFGQSMPDWLFPHRGYSLERIVRQTFLDTLGVFGVALNVMFKYVFLFVIFGSFLKICGATQFIIDFAQRVFGRSPGGPAKVAVLSSGMMGSLSGSAVANTATTGTFTIPLMRSSGFKPEIAAGVEAAASSGGALVPPVMGAGAYMMMEIINVPYIEIIRAAIIPAVLYYLSLFFIVHFYSKRIGVQRGESEEKTGPLLPFEGIIFLAAFIGLIFFLVIGYTAFKAVSLALALILIVSVFNSRTRITPKKIVEGFADASKDVIPLIAAAACVGIILGVVLLTGVGTKLPSMILPLAKKSLIGALILIMFSSIILGMGLPSSVCYLLMATLVGPALGKLGVVKIAAHFFIFYFGMLSMVTPPVALAAYAAGSIAGTDIMKTGLAAFRFALVGFTLPYMFVFRPELLMLNPEGEPAAIMAIVPAVVVAVLGIIPFAAGIAGFLFCPLSAGMRFGLFVSAALLLLPGPKIDLAGLSFPILAAIGLVLLGVFSLVNWQSAADRDVEKKI